MPDKNKSLQSLVEAWNEMDDETMSYLIGYGEGYVAGRRSEGPGRDIT